MTDITLTHLEPALTERLQQRASANGRTVEAEITAILTTALSPEAISEESVHPQSDSRKLGLGTAIRQLFAEEGGFDLPEMPREPIREPPTF